MCDCCGNPSARNFGDYRACNMCSPVEPEQRVTEGQINDNGRVRRARYREVTYKCTSPICDRNRTFHISRFVQEWLED